MGILQGQLGAPRGFLTLSKGAQEGSWGHLGSTLEASKGFAKQFAAICKNLQIYCKVLQKSRSEESELVENLSKFYEKLPKYVKNVELNQYSLQT